MNSSSAAFSMTVASWNCTVVGKWFFAPSRTLSLIIAVRCILGFRHDTIIGFLDPPLAGLRFILDLWLPSAGSSGQGF